MPDDVAQAISAGTEYWGRDPGSGLLVKRKSQGVLWTPTQERSLGLIAGPASNVLLRGGSRSGKTFAMVAAIVIRAMRAPGSRHAIWRYRFNHVKTSIWMDTLPKVMRLLFPTVRLRQNNTEGYCLFPIGSELWFGGLDEAERVEKVLGQEYATIFFNEVSQIPFESVLVGLTRLAQNVKHQAGHQLPLKALYDCNPPGKSHWTFQQWKLGVRPGTQEKLGHPERYVEMLVNPRDNAANLPSEYLEALADLPPRQRLRFMLGEWTSDVEGALWTLEGIDRDRISEDDLPENRHRVVVGVDPAVTSGEDAAETGIVVVSSGDAPKAAPSALDNEKLHGFVEADYSMRAHPTIWARQAVAAYHAHEADCIVAEVNNGGELVESVLRAVDPNVPIKMVHASRGKVTRAEPIAGFYDRQRVHHVGTFPKLEEQMSELTAGYVPLKGMPSPDRVDALVWALTELMMAPKSEVRAQRR
jgi:hypothetical protein